MKSRRFLLRSFLRSFFRLFIRCGVFLAAVLEGCVFPFPAEAGNFDIGHHKDIDQRIAALGTVAAELGSDLALLKAIKESMQTTRDAPAAAAGMPKPPV